MLFISGKKCNSIKEVKDHVLVHIQTLDNKWIPNITSNYKMNIKITVTCVTFWRRILFITKNEKIRMTS